MNMTSKNLLNAVLVAGLIMTSLPLFANEASPMSPQQRQHWRHNHPARTKDNERIRNQKKMLNKDLKSGKITQDQYNAQMKDLNNIKQEEIADARANENGGHLTGGQQQAINQQLNESRKDINQDVKNDQVAH